MTTIKVINDTDVGTTLDISTGKLEAASTMATDAEVAAAIAAHDASEANAKLRSDYVRRAQHHLLTAAMIEVVGQSLKFVPDASNFQTYAGRILVMGAGEGVHAGKDGFFNILPPAAGTAIKGLGIADSIVDVNGFIPFPFHGNLYYKLPAQNASNNTQGEWYMSTYSSGDYVVPEDFLLIAQHQPNISPSGMFLLYDGRWLFQGKNYTDTDWIDLAPYFAAGVSNYGAGHRSARFRRLNNRVYVEGLITCAANYTGVLATLPAGFTPAQQHLFGCVSANVTLCARVDANPSGTIFQYTANGGYVSLDGINFGLE